MGILTLRGCSGMGTGTGTGKGTENAKGPLVPVPMALDQCVSTFSGDDAIIGRHVWPVYNLELMWMRQRQAP